MKNVLGSILVAVMLLGAVGCETVKGVGRDVENAGEAIQKSTQLMKPWNP